MNKIGMHVHKLSSEAYQAIERLQPRVVVVMDPTPQWIRDIKAVAQNCYLGVRKYEHGVYFADRDPTGWADEIAGMCGDAIHLVDGTITYNEPLPAGHDDHGVFPVFDDWQSKVIKRLQDVHGVDGLAFAFGTGQFTAAPNRVKVSEAFPKSCMVCRVIAPHDYGWPNMWVDEGWHSMRWLAWLSDMENAGFDRKKVVVSECGLTQGVVGGPDVGWHTLHGNLMVAADLYLESLNWYNEKLVKVNDCIGCATFDWAGTDFGWGTFEHLIPYVIDGIEKIDHENGGNGMGIRVYDRHGVEQDWDWLVANYGSVEVHDVTEVYQPSEGELVYKVVYFREKTGDSGCIINVRDKEGNPVQGETVMWGWPDVEEHGYEIKPWDWTDGHGRPGDTNMNGDVGPGMGTGAYYKPPEIGPHWIWVWDRPSEFVRGIGMIAGTNHDHLDVGYQAVPWGEEPQPNGNISEQIIEHANEIIRLAQSGNLDDVAEVHLVSKSGDKRIFVPKTVASVLARLFGKT